MGIMKYFKLAVFLFSVCFLAGSAAAESAQGRRPIDIMDALSAGAKILKQPRQNTGTVPMSAHMYDLMNNDTRYLSNKIMKGQGSFDICVSSSDNNISDDLLGTYTYFAFKSWSSDVADMIKDYGREGEFADLIKKLQVEPKINTYKNCGAYYA